MPITRSGRFADAAILLTGRDDVFVAKIASSGAISPSMRNTDSFKSMRSGIASTMSATPSAAATRSLEACRRSRAASRSSGVTFPLATPASKFSRTLANPLESADASTSHSTVRYPACAAICAIPCPIVPAPQLAIFSANSASLSSGDPSERAKISGRPTIRYIVCGARKPRACSFPGISRRIGFEPMS
jgi:hypothetical protein